jgi:hypothetical protein
MSGIIFGTRVRDLMLASGWEKLRAVGSRVDIYLHCCWLPELGACHSCLRRTNAALERNRPVRVPYFNPTPTLVSPMGSEALLSRWLIAVNSVNLIIAMA